MTKPKVLITGASGLIGGLVLRDLADRYDFSGLSRHAVAGIPYTEASVTDLEAVRRAVGGVDMVLHLAGETKNDDNWDDHFNVTAGGTINVLRAAAEASVRRVVFMSTRRVGRQPARFPRHDHGIQQGGRRGSRRGTADPTDRLAVRPDPAAVPCARSSPRDHVHARRHRRRS